MSVDEATVRRVARLARIAITDEQIAPMTRELSAILDWVEQLDDLNTDEVQPMTSAVETHIRMRVDDISDGGYREELVSNAPNSDDGFFAVPKVVE